MTAGLATFIVVMTAILVAGSLLNSWIRARHRAPAADTRAAERQVELLAAENASLKTQLSRLEERMAVMERIATDPAERTAREIEQLRNHP